MPTRRDAVDATDSRRSCRARQAPTATAQTAADKRLGLSRGEMPDKVVLPCVARFPSAMGRETAGRVSSAEMSSRHQPHKIPWFGRVFLEALNLKVLGNSA